MRLMIIIYDGTGSMAVNVSADMKTGKSEFVNAGQLSNGIRTSFVPLKFIIWSVTLTVFLLHTTSFLLQRHL